MANAVTFDATFYLRQNPDVLSAIASGRFQGTAEQHFLQFGQFENRDPNQYFDTGYYLSQNPDVVTAIGTPGSGITSAFDHFVKFGNAEGVVRAPDAAFSTFNATTYLAANPDLQTAFGSLTGAALANAAFDHFLTFGVNENRAGSNVNLDLVSGNPGNIFTLTVNPDALTGTNGNDTFNAINGSANTLSAGDAVNGAAGTDTLNLLLDANGSAAALSGVSNVEIFNFRDTADGTTIDLATVTGETQVWNDRSTGAVTFNNLGAGTTVGVRGDGTTTVSATTFTKASATDAVSIAIDGGVLGGSNIVRNQTGEAAVTINSTGAANTVGTINLDTGAAIKAVTINATAGLTATLDAADYATASTLTIDGAGAVNLGGASLAANLNTVNAAANTGGVDILASNAAALSFTGGSGADRIVLGGTLGATDTINGGAGRDTVAISGVDLTAGGSADQLAGLNTRTTNVEVLEFVGATAATISGGTSATSFTNSTVDQLLFNTSDAAGTDTVNLAGARLYSFGPANDGNATFNSALGQTTLNLSLIGETAAAGNAGDVDTVTANGASTINIASTGGTTAANTIGSLAVAANSTINLTGSHSLTIGGVTNGSLINGSAATGVLNVTGSAAVDSITGGSANDILFGRAGADTLVGGAGNDILQGDGTGVAAVTAVSEVQTIDLNTISIGNTETLTVTFGGNTYTYTNATGGAVTGAALATAVSGVVDAGAQANSSAAGTVLTVSQAAGFESNAMDAVVAGTGVTGAEAAVVATTTQGVAAAAATIAAGGDTFGADILTGGQGNDNFRFVAGSSTATATDFITDLNLGTNASTGTIDTLTFQNAGATASVVTLLNSQQEAVTAAASLTVAAGLVASAAQADGATALFTYGSDTYLFHNVDGNNAYNAADDILVRVTGVTGVLDASDIALV